MNSDTLNPIGIPAVGGWIRPSWRPFAMGAGSPLGLDESGQNAEPTSLSCNGWTVNAGQTGLTLTPIGGIGKRLCIEMRPVTCCAPVPIPEPSASLSLPIGAAGLAGLSMLKGGA